MDWRYFFESILDAAWILERCLEAVAWVLLCRGIPRKWEDIIQSLAELAILTVMFFVITANGMVYGGDFRHLILTLCRGAVCAGYLLSSAPYSRKTVFVVWMAFFGAEAGLTALGGQISFLIGNLVVKGTVEGVVRILFRVVEIPLALILRWLNFDEFGTIPKSGMTMLVVGDMGLMMLYFVESLWLLTSTRIVATLAIAYFCMVAMEVLASYCLYQMCREQTEILNLQAEHQRLISEKETMITTQTRIEELRSIRHDLKNQYAYMQILLEEGRYQELEAYFHQISGVIPSPLSYIDCGNQTVNTILNMEFGKAKRENIAISYQLVVPPVLPFTEGDLCAILANILDNSIEECCRMRDTTGETPDIRLEIYPKQSYLLIVCSNATDRETLQRQAHGLRTTKKDDTLHGFGTRIISKTAERNNGCAQFRLENGRFICKVMLDLMEGERHANQNSSDG